MAYIKWNTSLDRPLRPKWGCDMGIDGSEDKRNVSLNDIYNYKKVSVDGFHFYLSLINGFYPKFIRNHRNGERWRMRFNVFVSGIFPKKVSQDVVLHIGELHLYYDLSPRKTRPWCIEFTFYYDDRPIDIPIIAKTLDKMLISWKDLLSNNPRMLMFAVLLPKGAHDFENPGGCLEQFLTRQGSMIIAMKVIIERQKKLNHQSPPNQPLGQLIYSNQWPINAFATAFGFTCI